MKNKYTVFIAIWVSLFSLKVMATPITEVTWTGGSVIGAATQVIPVLSPFGSDKFLGVSGGTYSFDMPGNSERGILQAEIDGVWTELARTATQTVGSVSLATAFLMQPFTPGEVTSLRLLRQSFFNAPLDSSVNSCNFFGGCWRNMSNVAFQFQPADVEEVPVPATLALFGLGLAGLGISRRKRQTHG